MMSGGMGDDRPPGRVDLVILGASVVISIAGGLMAWWAPYPEVSNGLTIVSLGWLFGRHEAAEKESEPSQPGRLPRIVAAAPMIGAAVSIIAAISLR